MKLTDRSGGFWGDLIVRRKNADLVVKQHFQPSLELMNKLGDEAISAVKGGAKHRFEFARTLSGGIIMHSFKSGTYRYGIAKQRSPDGIALAPLSDVTLRVRKEKGISRGPAFILRETSKHIFDGLRKKFVSKKRVEIGWDGFNEQLVDLNENDRSVENPANFIFSKTNLLFGGGPVVKKELPPVTVPARRIRGFSDEFRDNTIEILQKFLCEKKAGNGTRVCCLK